MSNAIPKHNYFTIIHIYIYDLYVRVGMFVYSVLYTCVQTST